MLKVMIVNMARRPFAQNHRRCQVQITNACKTLGSRNRVELRAFFLDWDFSAWGPAAEEQYL
jgi:hypothetical protein